MSEIAMNYMSAAEAVKLIESGDHVYLQASTSIPMALTQALADRGHELRDVTVYFGFGIGNLNQMFSVLRKIFIAKPFIYCSYSGIIRA